MNNQQSANKVKEAQVIALVATYRRLPELRRLVDCLRAQTRPVGRLVLADNAADPAVKARVAEPSSGCRVHIGGVEDERAEVWGDGGKVAFIEREDTGGAGTASGAKMHVVVNRTSPNAEFLCLAKMCHHVLNSHFNQSGIGIFQIAGQEAGCFVRCQLRRMALAGQG